MALLRLRRKQQKHTTVSSTIPIPPGSARKWRPDNSVRSHRSTLSRVREKEEPAGDVPRARPIGRVLATWNLFAGGKQAAEVEGRSRESARVSAVRDVMEDGVPLDDDWDAHQSFSAPFECRPILIERLPNITANSLITKDPLPILSGEDTRRSLDTGGNEIPIITTVVLEAGDLGNGRLTSNNCLPFKHWCHKRKSTFFSTSDQSTSWLAFGHP